MSGSQKYVVGAPIGPKSRGGVVMVLGGATGVGCAAAVPAPATIAPAPAASAWTIVRRDNALSCFSFSRCVTSTSRLKSDGRLIRLWRKVLRHSDALASQLYHSGSSHRTM